MDECSNFIECPGQEYVSYVYVVVHLSLSQEEIVVTSLYHPNAKTSFDMPLVAARIETTMLPTSHLLPQCIVKHEAHALNP